MDVADISIIQGSSDCWRVGENLCFSFVVMHGLLELGQNIKLTEDFGFAPSTLVYQGKKSLLALRSQSDSLFECPFLDRAAPLGKAKI